MRNLTDEQVEVIALFVGLVVIALLASIRL